MITEEPVLELMREAIGEPKASPRASNEARGYPSASGDPTRADFMAKAIGGSPIFGPQ